MPIGTATVTAKIGPGLSLTAQVINGITNINFDLVNQVLTLSQGDTITTIDISANNTSTLTFAAGVYTLTIS